MVAGRREAVSMRHGARAACGCLAAIFLAACATVPKVEMSQSATIKSVTMLRIVEPEVYPVVNLGGPTGMFGLVGGLVQAGLNDTHTKGYTEAVKTRQLAFASPFEQEIADMLASAGYRVTRVDARPALQADGKSADYTGLGAGSDAIVHVWFTALGYVSPPSRMDFQPWVAVRARVVDTRSRQDLYFKTFSCGWKLSNDSIVHVKSSPRYDYASYDALVQDLDAPAAGLRQCMTDIAALMRAGVAARAAMHATRPQHRFAWRKLG
jgi:hypothetical protein